MKDRPVVVVLAKVVTDQQTQVLVAPVTHSKPEAGNGVFVPAAIKRHLGLDDEDSWIITTEVNRFIWPGPDIRPAKGEDNPLHGAIPARLFEQVKKQISDNAKAAQVTVTKRSE